MYTKRGDRVPEEAAALRAARHPGVVELVDAKEDVLRTQMVDGRALCELAPLSAAEIAGLAAAVAATLADLHDLGVVHGGIDASHVLLTTSGSAVLCSLGRGGGPADDVAALGHLVTSLLSQAPPEHHGRGLGRGRLGRRQVGPMLAPVAGPTLLALAAEAMAPDPATRPTARALADAISRQIPAARLPRAKTAGSAWAIGGVPTMAHRSNRPGHAGAPAARYRAESTAVGGRVLGLVAVAAVLVGATVAVNLAPSRKQGPRPAGLSGAGGVAATRKAAPATPETRETTSTDVQKSSAPEPVRAAGSTMLNEITPTTTTPVATRVWPMDPLELKEGVLTFRGSRYAVGGRWDVVVAGDWACTGDPSLALLRRNTGQIFLFDGWPSGDGMVAARPLARVEGATDLRVRKGEGSRCDALEVDRPGAPPVRLEARAAS